MVEEVGLVKLKCTCTRYGNHLAVVAACRLLNQLGKLLGGAAKAVPRNVASTSPGEPATVHGNMFVFAGFPLIWMGVVQAAPWLFEALR